MSEKKFSMSEALSFGWNTMKDNIGFFIVLIITALLIEKIPGIIGNFAKDIPLVSLLLFFIGGLMGVVVQLGMIRVSLKFCDGKKGKVDDLFATFNLLLKFVAASVLYSIIFFSGMMLVVVFGVALTAEFGSGPTSFRFFFVLSLLLALLTAIWMIQFSLFPYFIVDREFGPVKALKASSSACKNVKFHLFLFGLLLGLINIAGFLVFVVGLFVTIPTSMVAYAYVYRTLAGREEVSKGEAVPDSGDGSQPAPETVPETVRQSDDKDFTGMDPES